MNKKIKIRLTVKTPLLISSGDKLLGIEYFTKDNYLYLTPVERIIDLLLKFDNDKIREQEKILEIIEKSMKQEGRNYDAKQFIKKVILQISDKKNKEAATKEKAENKITEKAIIKSFKLSEQPSRSGVELDFPIMSNNEPYIPGSSLKGAIKTAFYYYLLKKNRGVSEELIDELRRIVEYNLKDKTPNLDKVIYNENGFNSPIAEFIVRDLKFKNFQMVILDNQREGMQNKRGSKLDIGLYIAPGSIAEGEIILKKEFLEKSGITENEFITAIKESYSDFKKMINQRFGDIEFNGGDLQLGKHGDYFTKSIGTFLIEKAKDFKDNKDLIRLRKTLKFGKSPRGGCGNKFPKTISYVMYKNKKVQPGWVKIEMEEE